MASPRPSRRGRPRAGIATALEYWGTGNGIAVFAPSVADDPLFRERVGRLRAARGLARGVLATSSTHDSAFASSTD